MKQYSKLKAWALEQAQGAKALWIAWKHLRQGAPLAAYAMLLASLLSSAIAPISVLVYQQLVNAIAGAGHAGINQWILATIVLQAIDGGVLNGLILNGWDLWIQENMYQGIRLSLAEHFSHVLDADTARALKGDYQDIRSDIQRTYWSLSGNFFSCVEYLATTVGMLFLLVQLPPVLLAVVVARAMLSAFVSTRFGWGRYQKLRGQDPQRKRVFSGYDLADSSDELHHYNQGTSDFLMGLKASERMFLQKLKRLSWGRSRWRALIGVLGAVVTGAIYWYAAYHNHNIGAFTRFTSAANSFSTNLTQLLSSTGTISSGAQTARRAAKFLNIKPSTGSEVAPSDGRNARIEVRGLTVEFPSQKEGETKVRALDDLNLVIEPGEKVALMGKNGSGKSTIVDLLLGNNRDYIVGGSLYINGTEVRNWALIHLNDMQAICKQEVTTFPLTTAENVAFWGGKNVDLDLVRQVAQEIGFDLEEEGIDLETLLREDASGRNLSGGQAQKVSVLRALYHYYANRKVSLLIADECTSAIYSSDADRIYECMLSLEGTVILVTHAPHLAKIVGMHPQGRIIILNKGRIVEDGNHAMLVAARHEYYQLLKGGGIL